MDELQRTKEQQKQATLTDEQLQRSQQLMRLQSWDGLPEGDTKTKHLTDIFSFQTAYDQSVAEKMQRLGRRAEVRASAPVDQPPAAPEPAPEETYKQRRERIKTAKQAAKDLKEQDTSRQAAFTPEILAEATAKGYDKRALKLFCDSYKLNWRGKPASDADRATLERNREYLRKYVTGTEEEHNECLEEATQKILAMDLDLHVFDDEKYVMKHLPEIKEIGDRLTYFENIMQENRAWFDAQPQERKDKIAEKMHFYAIYSTATTVIARANGVESNLFTYTADDPEQQSAIRDARESIGMMRETYKKMWLEQAVDKEAKGYYEEERPFYIQQDALFQTQYGVSFPKGASELEYADIAKYREMIAKSPEAYAANAKMIDAMFSDLYRTFEVIGDKSLQMKAKQGVTDAHNTGVFSGTDDDLISQTALRGIDEIMKETDVYRRYANGLMDALKHLLTGSEPSEPAKPILERYRTQSGGQAPDPGAH
ncbi:MAG: hypothetical protein ACOX66_09565 [Oscillospiraceae bacterium]|jgi:hypothetical protein